MKNISKILFGIAILSAILAEAAVVLTFLNLKHSAKK